MLASLMLLLTPFMQLGFSYYASFNALMLILALVRWGPAIVRGALRANLLLAMVLLMGLPLVFNPSLDFNADFLRTAREAVMFIILAAALVAFRQDSPEPPVLPPLWVSGFAVIFIAGVCAVQSVLLPRGIYFGFPETAFAQETGTIASAEALRYGAEFLRPQATFSEPSYMGFVLLSFAMMLLPRTSSSRYATVLIAILTVAGLLSRSLSFLLAMAGVILLPLLLDKRANRGPIIVGSLVIGMVMLAVTNASVLIERLAGARSTQTADMSTLARINRPIEVIPRFLEAYPVGAPNSTIERAMAPFMPDALLSPAEILNNAVFNLIFLYGFAGILLFATLIFLAKDLRTRLYLVACAMFNGAFLAIDKVAMIMLTVALYETAKRSVANRANQDSFTDALGSDDVPSNPLGSNRS